MQGINPFGGRSPAQAVHVLIGESYFVVKAVYDNLPLIHEFYESEEIQWLFKHWDAIAELIENMDAFNTVVDNLDAILACGSAWRYIDFELEDRQNLIDKNHVSPSAALKVGDHLVTPSGNVFQIEWVSGNEFSVGSFITSIKGEKGDKGDTGTGLMVLGAFETLEAFEHANPVGHAGDAWIVGTIDPETSAKGAWDHVFVWDTNDNCWKDAGKLRGPKGETGASANVIKMLPDPAEYLLYLYENWDEIEKEEEENSDEEVIDP